MRILSDEEEQGYKEALSICHDLKIPAPTAEQWLELNRVIQDIEEDEPKELSLGMDVQDTITGFTGVATAFTRYLKDDDEQVCVENDKSERWFSINRLKEL